MVLPTDAASWTPTARCATRRGFDRAAGAGHGAEPRRGRGLPARLGGVLPILPANPQGRSFALHPVMGTLQTMFNNDKRLAILPNIGTLVMPTTKAQYAQSSHPKPASLFSHNDQQNTWQALAPEGATRGWGGRMGDMLASMNARAVFTSISAAGNAVWLAGDSIQQYQVGSSGAVRMGIDGSGRVFGSADVGAAMQRIVSSTRGTHVFERDVAALGGRAIDAEVALRKAPKPASDARFGTAPASGSYNPNADPKLQYDNPLSGGKSFNPLAQQLQMVARMVDASSAAGVQARRQVFFVSLGGFDTHDTRTARMPT